MATAAVKLYINDPDITGDTTPIVGMVEFAPTRARTATLDGHSTVVLPKPFTVECDGTTVETVHLEETGADWCWRARERTGGGRTRYVAVSSAQTALESVDYADLSDVDPDTLDPVAEPEAAWWAALNQFGVTFTDDGLGNYNVTYPAYADDGAGNIIVSLGV